MHDHPQVRPMPLAGHEQPEAYGSALILVACGAKKAATARAARELYTGPYFTDCLAAAQALVDDDSIRILSARHGLVRLNQVLAPYNMRLPHPDAITAAEVAAQARREGILDRPVTVFGGWHYVDLAQRAGWTTTAPLSGLGLGLQRKRLREVIYTSRLKTDQIDEGLPDGANTGRLDPEARRGGPGGAAA